MLPEFKGSGWVVDKLCSVHHRGVRSAENIVTTSDSKAKYRNSQLVDFRIGSDFIVATLAHFG